jgi:SAM-dependent methyltransferase
LGESRYDALWEGAWDEASALGPGFRSRYALLLRLMAEHGVSGRLLEVGAGGGELLRRVHRRFPWLALSAQEPSEHARKRLESLDFLEAVWGGELGGDFGAPGSTVLGHAGFHAIVCSEVLEHVPQHEGALDSLVRMLRPGGRLFLTVPLRRELWTPLDDALGHVRRYAPGELAAMCRARGLEIEADLALGFPFYNGYLRMMGSRSPDESAARARGSGPLARLAAGALTALFVAEMRVPSRLGGRGAVVARKPIPPGERGT